MSNTMTTTRPHEAPTKGVAQSSQPLANRWLLLALVPTVLALIAYVLRFVVHTKAQTISEMVPLTAALICIAILRTKRNPVPDTTTARPTPHTSYIWLWALVVAFSMSIIGDLFLHYHTTNTGYMLGIAFFLLAHLGYLTYALKRVAFRWPVFFVIVAALLVLYFVFFLPSPTLKSSLPMAVAVLAYLLVSCFSWAASIDISSRSLARWVFTAGISSIVISDACLALNDFAGLHQFDAPIMPLYFLAHVLVAFSVVLEFTRRH